VAKQVDGEPSQKDALEEEMEVMDPTTPAIEAQETVSPKLAVSECPICMEGRPRDWVLVPCGHMFCEDCVMNVFVADQEGKRKCPICMDFKQAVKTYQ
jgi:late competence protein required for DNA uptake (superfamily II DNA/RNA helicase)